MFTMSNARLFTPMHLVLLKFQLKGYVDAWNVMRRRKDQSSAYMSPDTSTFSNPHLDLCTASVPSLKISRNPGLQER
jgi:hypothetical protein